LLKAISNLLKGAVLGIAMVIPGLSGGTMALGLGIYERLIRALRRFSLSTVRETAKLLVGKERKARTAALWAGHDMSFLLVLLIGALASIFACSHLIKDLIDNHPNPTYGFFFGLVGASIIFPLRLMERKSLVELCCALIAIALTICTATMGPEQASGDVGVSHSLSSYGRFAICGVAASSAMLLPGVSGSFLLLLLGIYHEVLIIIDNWDYLLLGIFTAGCVAGLALFARLINFLLERYHSPTMAFLGGLMAGSLWNLAHRCELFEALRGEGDGGVGMTLLCILAGGILISALAWYDKGAKEPADTQSIGR